MYLVVSATETEMKSLRLALRQQSQAQMLVTGVGPVESAVTLAKHLAASDTPFQGVINFGVCGAYTETGLGLLDICLARREIFGDLGICYDNEIGSFDPADMVVQTVFDLRSPLTEKAEMLLQRQQIHYTAGNFVTVSCVSGTVKRGNYLRDKYQALCENMEGAALASVCQQFGVPFGELRCVSNLVEDRDLSRWRLAEACEKGAETALMLVNMLTGQ